MKSPKTIHRTYSAKTTARGAFSVAVMNPDGSYAIPFGPMQPNLILDAGLDLLATQKWVEQLYACAAGTGNTPTKDLPDGYYSQAGTTVTRESGTRDFISGDVGKLIRFADGTERKITAFIGATSVTVATSGSVPLAPVAKAISAASSTSPTFTITATGHGLAVGDRVTIAGVTPSGYNGTWVVATVPDANTFTVDDSVNPGPGTVFGTVTHSHLAIKIYRVNQTGLQTEAKRTTTAANFTDIDSRPSNTVYMDTAAALLTFRRTVDFTAEVGNVNYTEIGMSSTGTAGANLFSRILLTGAVTVLAGQQLRVKYELTIKAGNALVADQTTVEAGIAGWPRPYDIQSITSSGSAWTLTTTEAHHFIAGGKINIDGALRPLVDITAASSTVSDFTITAPGHGRTGGDSIVIEGVSPSGYNGTFTIASVVGDDITVTSVLNPGTGTVFGTVRQATPAPWYDGEHTIASVTSTTVVITSALSIAAAGESGEAYGNTKRKLVCISYGLSLYGTGILTDLMTGLSPSFMGCCMCADPNDGASGVQAYGIHDPAPNYMLGVVQVAAVPAFKPLGFPRVWFNASATGTQLGSPGLRCHNEAGAADSGAVGLGLVALNKDGTVASYTNGNFYRDVAFVFVAGELNLTDIKRFFFGAGLNTNNGFDNATTDTTPQAFVDFEEVQRKDSTHKLTVTLRRAWGRDLETEPS